MLQRRAYARYRQLSRMMDNERHERNTFLLAVRAGELEKDGLITCVQRGDRHQAWYVITEKGKRFIQTTPEPSNPDKQRRAERTSLIAHHRCKVSAYIKRSACAANQFIAASASCALRNTCLLKKSALVLQI
jgi:hypothetical protein